MKYIGGSLCIAYICSWTGNYIRALSRSGRLVIGSHLSRKERRYRSVKMGSRLKSCRYHVQHIDSFRNSNQWRTVSQPFSIICGLPEYRIHHLQPPAAGGPANVNRTASPRKTCFGVSVLKADKEQLGRVSEVTLYPTLFLPMLWPVATSPGHCAINRVRDNL